MYERLNKVITEKGISRHKLAKLSGINHSDLYSALKGNKPLYKGWRVKISEALGMSEDELFTK